jgi:NAD(P)-dependent dehydrogenase (short-subunit alcohol dehydrogenase family)
MNPKSIAIITGGSSGLGSAISRALAAKNHLVFNLDIQTPQLEHKQIKFLQVDLTIEEAVKKSIDEIFQETGRIDILVNAAGITGKTAVRSHETSTEDVNQVFRVNFMASYFTSKHTIPHMLTNKYGRILHIASIAGKEGNAGMLAYSASKAAVIGMTKVQGKEYAETGITINALAPAVIRTPMVDALPEKQVTYMTDKIPMKRCGTLEEVAAAALYIVSPENSFTTGFTFDLSGGRATY